MSHVGAKLRLKNFFCSVSSGHVAKWNQNEKN